MKELNINHLEGAFKIEESDPFKRIAYTVKVSLSFFPTLKELFFSEDINTKIKAKEAIVFIIDRIEKEIELATSKTGLNYQQILGAIYQANHLTPVECQMFLQAQSLVMMHNEELFNRTVKQEIPKKTKTKRKPKIYIGA